MLLSGSGTMIVTMEVPEPEEPSADRPEEPSADRPEEPPTSTLPIWGWEPSRAPGTALGGPPPRRRSARVVVATVLAAMVFLAAGIGIGWIFSRGGSSTGAQAPLTAGPATSAPAAQSDQRLSVKAITDRVNAAVVNINTVIDSDPFDSIPAR